MDNELVISELSRPTAEGVVVLHCYAADVSKVIVRHAYGLQVVNPHVHV